MKARNAIKYQFSKKGAQKASAILQILVNNKYLDRNGDLKKVQKVMITPFDINQLETFLRHPTLFSEYEDILNRYDGDSYAILLFVESLDGRIVNYTIEEFESEFGIPPFIMEMVLDHNKATFT